MARMRSTGLGKTEVHARITKLRPAQDVIIMEMKTTKPVRWNMCAALQPEDRLTLIKLLFKLNFKLLKFVFNWNPNKGKHPEPAEF